GGAGEMIAVGLDVRGERLQARGWTEDAGDLHDVLARLDRADVARYVVTDVAKDGMLQGPNLELLKTVMTNTAAKIVASGGVSTLGDLRDHSDDQVPVDPVLSVLAVTIGWIIIVPPFVSLYRTAGRIRRVQEITGARKRISPGLALLLAIVSWTMLIDMPYLQTHINSAWD